MKKTLDQIKYWLFLNIGILLMSSGIYFFKAPNGFATGGVSGIAIILTKILPYLTQATYMLIINVLLLILGLLILGKECGVLTFYCSIVMSLENLLFERLFPLNAPLTSYPLLELVYAVLLTGIGSAIIFKSNASSGGTDIVALILKKYTSLNVGQALFISDVLIASSTFFVYGTEAGLFSILGLFAKVFVVDDILDSINMCKSFTIVTTRYEEVEKFILEKMHHGATVYDARGAYSNDEKKVILTVCKRSEAINLRKAVKKIDPEAFIVITKTSEIMGKGFRDNI